VATIDDVAALALRLPDVTEAERHGNLAAHREAFFTIPHFDGYSAVLIQLPKISAPELREAVTDGRLACAPPALARQFLDR
jgi:hypothetical protein